MAVDMNQFVKLNALDALASKADTKIKAVETKADNAFKGAKVLNGNSIALYTTTDTTGDAALTLDLPAELVVDATKTKFVTNFSFVSEDYPNATDPDLDGKTVLVLAIKTTDKGVDTTSYSFLSADDLVIKISTTANNAIELKSDGLHVDITGKQDKDEDAVENNIAKFDVNGNAVDAGIAAAKVLTSDMVASDNDVQTVLSSYFN